MMAYSQQPLMGTGTVPPPSAPGVSGALPGAQAVNTTKVLSLTGFSKELKTRDIQNIFVDFEDDRGGYRIKWLDDTGCLLIFSDPITAKRAFLHLLANPHPHLLPFTNAEGEKCIPTLAPYTKDDVQDVIKSVALRPRSRSIASNNAASGIMGSPGSTAHNRRLSNSSHARMGSSASTGSLNGQLAGTNGSIGRSFGRASISQNQMQSIRDESGPASGSAGESSQKEGTSPPSPPQANGTTNGGAIDWGSHQVQQQANRARVGSGSFSPPTSPERGLPGSGATSPSRMRRLIHTTPKA